MQQAQAKEDLYFRAFGVRLRKKHVSLVLLVVQTTVLVLLMRYTRSSGSAEDRYLSSTAVVAAEGLKLVLSVLAMRFTSNSPSSSWESTLAEISLELRHRDTIKLAVPGLLYLIQNNLLFVALSNLDAAVYQVTYQLKILTTAMFSVCMLGRKLDSEQVFSLVILTLGVSLVQYAEMLGSGAAKSPASTDNNDPALGLACVLLACFSSGFAGVYLEKVMKKTSDKPGRTVSLWMRNVQLGGFGIVFGLAGIFFSNKELEIVSTQGFFRGYTGLVWLVVVIQALGGFCLGFALECTFFSAHYS
ncbi:hypothetical protein BASA81_001318 [Batrachochytrium salamandrivorans]|nr:hypothetical protein BASA81_001318 [Batrachochytrium salamandrivorans]